ncbi:hypothetical protein QTO30_09730 [Yoonia sp. GPGPB17]|uniref:hypothetical protein n=1 Tax=Yoonia sp. GPGPB17 TaxID=3026147 RepID=UPI0030BC521C
MGREAVAVCHWNGETAEAKLHLDSAYLQLRGEMRADIPRAHIRDVVLVDAGVRVITDGPELTMEFGASEAARWQKALLKKPPTLAEKLGVSADTPAFILGTFDDAPLKDALCGATVTEARDAAILLAILVEEADLQAASDMAMAHPDKHIWMIHRKGKTAMVNDSMIRRHMRGLGFIDSKTSAVSDQLTTTRYRMRAK